MADPTPFPQYRQPDSPDFQQYPRRDAPNDDRSVLLITTLHGEQTRIGVRASRPMPEADAIALIDAICHERSTQYVDVNDADTIVRISDREVVVFGRGEVYGPRTVRVQVGTVQGTKR